MNSKYKTLFLNDSSQKEWDNLVIANSGNFLQSWSWGELQKKIGRKIWRVAIFDSTNEDPNLVALLIKHPLPLNKCYFYSPRGPLIIKNSGGFQFFMNEIGELSQEEDSIFLKIEPVDNDFNISKINLRNAGLKKDKAIQPENTLLLDLTKEEGQLLEEMQYETKYAVRAAERRGVKIIKSNDANKERYFEEFWRVLLDISVRHKFKIYPKEYYWSVLNLKDGFFQSELFMAELENKIIASAIIISYGKVATYLYASSATGFGRFNAPTFLLWKAILDAKKKGCEVFDFWGISETNKKWRGLSAFKKSFGGKEISYLGAWDFVYKKNLYAFYRVVKNTINLFK